MDNERTTRLMSALDNLITPERVRWLVGVLHATITPSRIEKVMGCAPCAGRVWAGL